MTPYELLSKWPGLDSATAAEIFASPAWALTTTWGARDCVLAFDAVVPADTLDVAVRFEDDEHVIALADSPAFPELHRIWGARAQVPEPILLALVERECGPLFQILENAARRQLSVAGLAKEAPAAEMRAARVETSEGEGLCTFSLSLSPALVEAFGELRNLDPVHESILSRTLPAEVEYASFTLTGDELAGLAPGDALLLPEVPGDGTPGTPRLVAAGRFVLEGGVVSDWAEDRRCRVLARDPVTVSFGQLADPEASDIALRAPMELKLVRAGRLLAEGRFVRLASASAFQIESTGD